MSESERGHPISDDRQRPENFWTVGTTAMTEDEAEQAAALIEERFPEVDAFAVDPRAFLTLGLDRWTAEMLREAVGRLAGSGSDVGSMLEDLDEILARARPYDQDEERWSASR